MKRLFSFFLVSLLTISLSLGCARAEGSGERLQIVTTIFPPFDFTRQIVKDNADVTMLLRPGAESHSYEPTPQDIKNIQNADLLIYNGGENDVWVEEILASMGDQKPDTLKMMDCVQTVAEEIEGGMEHEHDHEHEAHEEDHEENHDHEHDEDHNHDHEAAPEMDEHVWTSPKNAMAIVRAIAKTLSVKDAANAASYAENSQAYITELEALDAAFRTVCDAAPHKTLLFGDRFPFRYLADEYGLTYYAAFTGCSTETEASAATVAFLIDKAKAEKLPVIFTIEMSNGKIADSICEAVGAEKALLHSCHNVTRDELAAGETYLTLMTKNVQALQEALQ